MIVDLRHEQRPGGPDPRCGQIKGGKLVLRDPTTVDAICLHQTAVTFSARRSDIDAEHGDKQRARWRRALGVHAHVTAFDDGAVVPAYPLAAYVWHGNSANERSIGLEIEGAFNGRPGGKNGEPGQLVIAAAREAVEWIVAEAAREGMTIRYVLAHRQYSPTRQSDPGWSIWRDVALWAEASLGLQTLPHVTGGGGRPIPREWDPREQTRY